MTDLPLNNNAIGPILKRLFYLILIPLISNSSAAQNISDSLLSTVKYMKNDTIKVDTLNARSSQSYSLGNSEEGEEYANLALSLAKSLRYNAGIAEAYNNIGNAKFDLSPDAAFPFYTKSLAIWRVIGNQAKIANEEKNIGNVYAKDKQYDIALKYDSSALLKFEKLHANKGTANCYLNIANVYLKLRKYNDASISLYKVLAIEKKLDSTFQTALQTANTLHSLGLIYI